VFYFLGGITPSTQPLVSLESVHVSGQGRVSLHTTPRHNETTVVLTPKSYDIPTHLLALEKVRTRTALQHIIYDFSLY
jgi:hypothetical protein